METCWMGVLAALVVLAGLPGAEYNNQILDGPRDATVLAGSEARFNCTVSDGWKLIMWALNGVVVLSLTPTQTIITNERFTSERYWEDGNLVSELIIYDVQPKDAGQVRCSLQDSDRDRSALLAVQVVGTLSIPKTGHVLKGQPCNVTCCASGWIPLPELSWKLEISANNWSYSSTSEPSDPQRTSSILTLVPHDNGSVTCVAAMRGLPEHKSITANLTVVSSLGDDSGQALPTWAIALLAVSFSLLLILIIVLVVLYCCYYPSRREKKGNLPK
ncbi:immunoglobulin superfamily member 5 [Suncus etruscus]|uniref:immunoglobulin superfamily member 5 n=1 Tax=Suncus etruscus TaxID=109475 RepID=UPI002110AA24|nr:immunoglobulin superfamily member 5 [Suncus etruscus]